MRCRLLVVLLLFLPAAVQAQTGKGNRLAYLDELDPYYVGRTFPKLTTPQWVGEPGVEAVVILAIDDMRDHKKYETYLRPILNRLKKIDGRAPVSIMTCQIDPKEPHLQQWLKEGLSFEIHTYDHPCPFFKSGSFAKAKETYDKCVDLISTVPGNKPVCYRMPCCDSLNTPSPRHWAEIFNKVTEKGNFLTMDSSVFHLFTSDDPELPRELVLDKDGTEKFKKYLPKDRTFVNTIENYPYPYVLGGLCWQFPCMGPSDWLAQHYQGKNNPLTVQDWKAALDLTVIKQGAFNMVFHPHGWITAEQVVEFIDHAVEKHGKKVKFLTFKEAEERINKHLLAGQPLRDPKTGGDNFVRLLDMDNDGYLDVLVANSKVQQSRIWSPKQRKWVVSDLHKSFNLGPQSYFGVVHSTGRASMLVHGPSSNDSRPAPWWHFSDDNEWWPSPPDDWDKSLNVQEEGGKILNDAKKRKGVLLRDLDGDGICELLVSNPNRNVGFTLSTGKVPRRWEKLPFSLPEGAILVNDKGNDNGIRFFDLNEDGKLDVLFSNEKDYGVYLFTDMKSGWSQKVIAGKRGDKGELPPFTVNGTNFGAWFHSRHIWWGNETTPLLKDHVDRISFKELLQRAGH